MSLLVNDDDSRVFVAAVAHEGRKAGFVITWVSEASLSRRSPKIVLVVSKHSSTLPLMEKAGSFSLNLLSSGQKEEFFTFGSKASSEVDKFAFFNHRAEPPYLDLENSAGHAHCTIDKVFETPDRKILYCSILEEEKRPVRPMVLSEVIPLLSGDHQRRLAEKRAAEAQRDEGHFPLSES